MFVWTDAVLFRSLIYAGDGEARKTRGPSAILSCGSDYWHRETGRSIQVWNRSHLILL